MARTPRNPLLLQIVCGGIIAVGIGMSWMLSEVPFWELQSPDGPYYLPGWRSAVVLLLLVCATQLCSIAIFRRAKQTVHLWDFVCRYQVITAFIVVLLTALVGWGWMNTASYRGQFAARLDLVNGHTRLLSFGLPVPWQTAYVRLLRERHGVEVRAVAGCIVSKPLMDFVNGYNQVSMRAARQRWGRDVFTECSSDASQLTPLGRAIE